MSSPISRGFRHLRRPSDGEQGRVPPGQYVTQDFPVLSAGPTPHTPLPEWTFSIRQSRATLKSWTWQEFQALPTETVTVDVHCVTRWSKLEHDEPGFWDNYGYHMYGDPWREQRYAGD